MEQKRFNTYLILILLAAFGVTWGIQAYTTNLIGSIGSANVSILITGSTTCEPVITTCSEEFMILNPTYDISVSGTGSGPGITDTVNGLNDIGMASRNIKSSENESAGYDLIDYKFAKDAISVIISANHPNVTWLESNGLTMLQVFSIYNGSFDTWDDIDPSLVTDTIDCYTRSSGSGTRATFEELVVNATGGELGDNPGYQTAVLDYPGVASNSLMVSSVASNTYGFGYCGLGYVDDTVVAVPVDGYEPSVATVLSGFYPISRSLHLVTNGPVSGYVQAFIDYVFSYYGQQVVADEGFIRIWY